MNNEKFIRKYKLTIGEANSSSTGSKQSVVIQDSHIVFDISIDHKSKLNNLDLKIYNLKKETIAVFDTKDVLVSLEVAYGDEPFALLFRGNKTTMQTIKEPPNTITKVLAAEGYVSVREGRMQNTQPEGTTVEQILRALIKEGFPDIKTVQITGDGAKRVYNKGYSVTGNTKKALDDVCAANNLLWTIEKNDTIYIYPRNGSIKYEAIIISPTTGLLATPEKTSQEIRHLKKDLNVSPDAGIKFKSLLNPLLKAGALIKIEDTFDSDGTYRVDKISHSGGYEDEDWTSTVEAVTL